MVKNSSVQVEGMNQLGKSKGDWELVIEEFRDEQITYSDVKLQQAVAELNRLTTGLDEKDYDEGIDDYAVINKFLRRPIQQIVRRNLETKVFAEPTHAKIASDEQTAKLVTPQQKSSIITWMCTVLTPAKFGIDKKHLHRASKLLVIGPTSIYSIRLEDANTIASLYTVIAEPYLLSLAHYSPDWRNSAPGVLIVLSTACDLFFMLDFLAGFCKGYTQRAGHKERIVMRLDRTAAHYLRTWFLPDLLSLAPVQLAVWAGNHRFPSGADFLVVASALKALRIARAWHGAGRRFGRPALFPAFDLCRDAAALVALAHWTACFWLVVVAQTTPPPGSDVCNNRTALVRPAAAAGPGGAAQYACALAWSAAGGTTTGLADMLPRSAGERAVECAAVLVLASAAFYGLAELVGRGVGAGPALRAEESRALAYAQVLSPSLGRRAAPLAGAALQCGLPGSARVTAGAAFGIRIGRRPRAADSRRPC